MFGDGMEGRGEERNCPVSHTELFLIGGVHFPSWRCPASLESKSTGIPVEKVQFIQFRDKNTP